MVRVDNEGSRNRWAQDVLERQRVPGLDGCGMRG